MIANKMIEIEQWRDMATGLTGITNGDKVQSSGVQQRMADAVCRYVQIEDEVAADINELIKTRKEVIRLIESLPAAEYDILHKRYIQNMELYEIADAAGGKSYSWATALHGRALMHVQRLLDERENK